MDFAPVVLLQTINTISFSWNKIENADVYKLEMLFKINGWTKMYWGSSNECTIRGLEEGWHYNCKIVAMQLNGEVYIPIMESQIFRAVTKHDQPNNISLYRALIRCEEHVVRRYLMLKPELVDCPGPKGLTPLAVATTKGDKSIVNIIISAGANIDVGAPAIGRTPLHMAMFNGFTDIAKVLVIKKADKLSKDCVGMNYGHYAIDGGHIRSVKFYIDSNGDIEEKDKCGMTLLLRAIYLQCDLSIIKLLLENNANIFACDGNKLNCFNHARMNDRGDILEILEKYEKKYRRIKRISEGKNQ